MEMNSDIVIEVKDISKRYQIGAEATQYETFAEELFSWIKSPINNFKRISNLSNTDDTLQNSFTALSDINFEVKRGEVLGVIGHNGAGKSTLLKILSRITEPTEGEIMIKGRVSSLLEVGTGFHPELSGRDNIYMNGTILGMTKKEIDAKFEQIVQFSGIGKHLDTPVKRYSSGMKVRLAFSVAAHLEPEILIIDEVLAVGDAEFQKKCLGKMQDVAGEGRTVLFVSHNMVAIKSLCHKVLWLERGKIKEIGLPNETVTKYLNSYSLGESYKIWNENDENGKNEYIKLVSFHVKGDTEKDYIATNNDFKFEIEFIPYKENLEFTLHIVNEDEVIAFGTSTAENENKIQYKLNEVNKVVCNIPKHLLNIGYYRPKILVVTKAKAILKVEDVVTFEIVDDSKRDGAWMGKKVGVFRPKLNWNII